MGARVMERAKEDAEDEDGLEEARVEVVSVAMMWPRMDPPGYG